MTGPWSDRVELARPARGMLRYRKPAREALAEYSDLDDFGRLRLPNKCAGVHARHSPAIFGDGPFVFEIQEPVIVGSFDRHGDAGREFAEQPPGTKDGTLFKKEVPVWGRVIVCDDSESGH
jgi:hypothetical protein